jgi:hypothetical protein
MAIYIYIYIFHSQDLHVILSLPLLLVANILNWLKSLFLIMISYKQFTHIHALNAKKLLKQLLSSILYSLPSIVLVVKSGRMR